ncbi:MAG: AAA family ATPase [Nitrososphaerales archaeon]|nr:AAA family ATPase [Nitrososphaerales archaeon]
MIEELILVTGMPGSGKSIVKEVAEGLGIPVLTMGDVIRGEVKRRGLKEEVRSYVFVMKDIRRRFGAQIVAKRVGKKLTNIKAKTVCIEGVRSLEEVEYFRRVAKEVHILALVSSFKIRLERLSSRNRLGDLKTEMELEERDKTELKVGMGDVIAKADYYLLNDERPIDDFRRDIRRAIIRFIQ